METLASRIWIWLSIACAALWLAISARDILDASGALEGKINLAAMSILFAGVIIAAGFGLQRLSEYFSDHRAGVAK